jgi:hypothetical protein
MRAAGCGHCGAEPPAATQSGCQPQPSPATTHHTATAPTPPHICRYRISYQGRSVFFSMVLRQTCQLICSILLIVRNHQASNFSRNRSHFFNQTTRTTLMTPDPSMKDRISSDVPMGIRRRAYPSLLTGPSPSCSHASCKASTHSCSKRLRITMLQADDSSYNLQ